MTVRSQLSAERATEMHARRETAGAMGETRASNDGPASLPMRFDTENDGLKYGSSGWAAGTSYFTMTLQRREYPGPYERGIPNLLFAARSGTPLHLGLSS